MQLDDSLSNSPALGRRLRLARDRAGVSMFLAARRTGLSRREIQDVERGSRKITLSELEILSGLYGVLLEALLPPEVHLVESLGTRE